MGGSDTCYFCQKRVYVMERLSAEGKFFHRSCFKCEHCATTLRLSAYAYALEDGELPMPRCTWTQPPLLAHADAFFPPLLSIPTHPSLVCVLRVCPVDPSIESLGSVIDDSVTVEKRRACVYLNACPGFTDNLLSYLTAGS